MQVFGNVATDPVRKESKASGKGYFEFRLAESHRALEREPATFYTCRVMKDADPHLAKGDFVKVTGRLKTDFYLSREGKPTGTLLIIAFEAAKISKPLPATAVGSPTEVAAASKTKAMTPTAHEVATSVPASAQTATQAMLVDWTD
ncbi:single-stranded DNA-binding protein [Ramlibacter sp. G-1-2-2]|uniref:Single-stranded DNA-binding protein n=1 Tax=Ramlibacter agri TaxID=2728837 RepID=A0A848H8V4_9BURK|nr:single-stranded DNA-binding protein [Ramlibacter agri]NML45939.1 single-stranded DNA-binding protein [Ramlibacter agri]